MNNYWISFQKPTGEKFRVEQKASDIYAAIDLAKAKYPNDRFYLATINE